MTSDDLVQGAIEKVRADLNRRPDPKAEDVRAAMFFALEPREFFALTAHFNTDLAGWTDAHFPTLALILRTAEAGGRYTDSVEFVRATAFRGRALKTFGIPIRDGQLVLEVGDWAESASKVPDLKKGPI